MRIVDVLRSERKRSLRDESENGGGRKAHLLGEILQLGAELPHERPRRVVFLGEGNGRIDSEVHGVERRAGEPHPVSSWTKTARG